MTDDVGSFLDVGLQRYPEARRAVDAFEEALDAKLRSVFYALPSGNWEFVGSPRRDRGEEPNAGYYYSMWREVLLHNAGKERKAWFDAGLWWDWQVTSDKCVIYATIGNSNDVPLAFDYRLKVEGVALAKSSLGCFLYRPVTIFESLEADLATVVAARLAQPEEQ